MLNSLLNLNQDSDTNTVMGPNPQSKRDMFTEDPEDKDKDMLDQSDIMNQSDIFQDAMDTSIRID